MNEYKSFNDNVYKHNQFKLYIEMLTNFIYKIQDKLDINLTESEKYSFVSIDKMSLKALQIRLNKIEEKINLLVDLQSKNNVNDLVMKIKEDNATIERELEQLKLDYNK